MARLSRRPVRCGAQRLAGRSDPRGLLYDKEARRQAKETAGQHAGKMELTACVDYCTHILVNKLGLTWAGTTGGGALMVHDRVQRVVCLPLRLDDIFLTVQQVLLLFILGAPIQPLLEGSDRGARQVHARRTPLPAPSQCTRQRDRPQPFARLRAPLPVASLSLSLSPLTRPLCMLHCSVPLLCVVVAAAVQLSLALRCLRRCRIRRVDGRADAPRVV